MDSSFLNSLLPLPVGWEDVCKSLKIKKLEARGVEPLFYQSTFFDVLDAMFTLVASFRNSSGHP